MITHYQIIIDDDLTIVTPSFNDHDDNIYGGTLSVDLIHSDIEIEIYPGIKTHVESIETIKAGITGESIHYPYKTVYADARK